MKKTLVLVVDRDDDFGVKGKVNTPVIGVQNCLDAATAFGIADPEDSDLNALFAAVSVCLEIQEDGHEADVALICGDEKVGHRSDLALVAQLEEVLDEIQPDSVVLVGDGAEDEYIYPIISSRAHVDSVRKVYVKQSPGIEGSFYIITKMLSDPGKRKRFLVPLGFIIVLLSLFFIMPALLVYSSDHDINTLASMSGSLAFFFIGVVLILYGYNVSELYQEFRKNLISSLAGDTTRLLFLCVSLSIVLLMAVWNYVEVNGLYITSVFQWILYYFTSLVWPIVIAIMVYVVGQIIQDYQTSKTVKLSLVFGCIGIVNLGLVLTGVLDLISHFVWDDGFFQLGVIEIVAGVIISILSTYVKGRYIPAAPKEARPDEAF
ncbi:DUF373 family protein [Methanomassiliicoccaceae archaeon DOK]|nr:DUF373 family protein [Methanomassiliicoccaceae archaeon DOK]